MFNSSSLVDVVIIGAGAAGLAAAQTCDAAGLTTITIEASTRIGGRAYTVADRHGLPIDLGASWIHAVDHGNPWFDIAVTLGHRVERDQRRRIVLDPKLRSPRTSFANAISSREHALSSLGSTVKREGNRSAGSILEREQPWDAEAAAFVGPWLAGVDTDVLDAADWINSFSGDDYMLPQGYGSLVAAYARSTEVMTHCAALSVEVDDNEVTVTTNRGRLRCRHAIVTCSTGVLAAGSLLFRPPLAPAHAAAIASLPMGLLSKVVLVVEGDPLGFGDGYFLHLRQDREDSVFYLVRPHGRALIYAFLGGGLAWRAALLSNETLKELVIQPFGAEHRLALRRSIVDVHTSRWGTDRHFLGSYSYAVPGLSSQRLVLAEPMYDRVWFAGEASAPTGWQSTVAGAYLAGREAAKQILQR